MQILTKTRNPTLKRIPTYFPYFVNLILPERNFFFLGPIKTCQKMRIHPAPEEYGFAVGCTDLYTMQPAGAQI